MTWQDRLKEGAYNSPSGERHVFAYEDLSRSFDKKTSSHDFPNADGTYIQDNGRTGRKYPITAYFSGPNCDTDADAFEESLGETGRGKLEHPIYGTVDVVPFGTVTRNDSLKSAANQSVVEVTFWETIPLIYPIPQADPTSNVLGAAAEVAGGLADLPLVSNFQEFKAKFENTLTMVQSVLGKITDIKNAVESAVRKAKSYLDQGVEGILGAITTVVEIMALPSTVVSSFKSKLASYQVMLDQVLGGSQDSATYESGRIFAAAIVTAQAIVAVESEFQSGAEALSAADTILSTFDDVNTWNDSLTSELSLIDTGQAYRATLDAAALTAGYLVQISFTLKKERKIILTRSRTIIDLAAELYGEVDSILDFFINSNEFTGSEIVEVPKGRGVLYYV